MAMKKRLISLFCSVSLLCAVFTGCTGNPNTTTSGTLSNQEVKLTESGDTLTLDNGNVSLSFVKENGSLVSVKNPVTGTDFIQDSAGGNWALNIDMSTDDPFQSNPTGNNTVLVTSRKQTMTYTKNQLDNGIELVFDYDVEFEHNGEKVTGLKVRQSVCLKQGEATATFTYDVENNIANSVVTTFTGAQISGIKNDNGDFNLFWPYKEGKIYEEAVKTVKTAKDDTARMVAQYPSPMSMQLIQLYNDSESLYYYVADSTREYKEFNFGAFINKGQYDFQGVQVADKVSLSCSRYPFIASGNKAQMTTVVGISNNGDWYDGSNAYRQFLLDSGMTKDTNDLMEQWTGFSALIGTQYGNKQFASYTQAEGFKDTYVNWAESTNQYGVTTTTLIGWHAGGFDSMYPDYEFQTGNGFGEEAFRQAMEQGHANGNTFLAYINAHIADKESKWSNTVYDATTGITNMEQAAIKTKGFSNTLQKSDYMNYMIQESYGTGTYYYAMCPGSALFQDALVQAVKRLRSNGIDGIWFDQLMEMPAELCYDKSHGHTSPATAYGEGYAELFAQIELAMASVGGDYLFAAEGVCDAWIEYVDVCGYMWSRKLGGRDTDGVTMVPEMTRYTMPAIFLGIESAGTTSGDSDEFARAFVMSDPFLADPYKPSVGSLTGVYAQDSTYLTGRYMDKIGAVSSDENLIFGQTVSLSDKKIALTIYNYNTEASTGATISIDLGRLGFENVKIDTATDMFTGSKVSVNGNTVELPAMEELGIVSILITLK